MPTIFADVTDNMFIARVLWSDHDNQMAMAMVLRLVLTGPITVWPRPQRSNLSINYQRHSGVLSTGPLIETVRFLSCFCVLQARLETRLSGCGEI
jgi:hypothetical protein